MFSFGKFKMNFHASPKERGQAIVLYAVGMVALIAVIGLATDATMIYKTKQDLQRAVDSAALAGAYKLPKKPIAIQATAEFMRLHGYNSSPCGLPIDGLTTCDTTQPYLNISFPNEATQKIVHVVATTDASYFFLRIIGFNTMTVKATGEGEAAPMDVYLILDLSESMTYDTTNHHGCSASDSDCIAQKCNQYRDCAPLDTSVKPAAKYFVNQLDSRYDRIGLVVFDQYATNIMNLSSDFTAVNAAIDGLNAYDHQLETNCSGTKIKPGDPLNNASNKYCAKQTDIGDGILVAHKNLADQGHIDAIWSIVLLTDGKANAYRNCDGPGCITNTDDPHCREQGSCCPPNCDTDDNPACGTVWLCSECDEAETWALNNAFVTWKFNETVIYTIAYGSEFISNPSYKQLLIDIADWTDNGLQDGSTSTCPTSNWTGNCFQAPDGPSLQAAFAEIASRIYARLLQ